jgi:hypothetical protein
MFYYFLTGRMFRITVHAFRGPELFIFFCRNIIENFLLIIQFWNIGAFIEFRKTSHFNYPSP